MAGATKAQRANALITFYVDAYEQRHDRKPLDVNRYADRWGFESMIEDLGYDRALLVVEDFLSTRMPSHSVKVLLKSYHKINKHLLEVEEDAILRAQIREDTRRLVEGIEGT